MQKIVCIVLCFYDKLEYNKWLVESLTLWDTQKKRKTAKNRGKSMNFRVIHTPQPAGGGGA